MEGCWTLIVVGAILIVIGVINLIKTICMLHKCTQPAVACIVEVKREVADIDENYLQYGYIYIPVYEYSANGEKIRCDGKRVSANEYTYQINDTVNIRYNPKKTTEFFIEDQDVFIGVGGMFFMVGLCMVIIALMQPR